MEQYTNITTLSGNNTFSFGQHYAVLNLDMINLLVESVASSPQGSVWVNATKTWIDAVHAQNPAPLSIYTRIYYANSKRPEVGPDTPFGAVIGPLGNLVASNASTHIYNAFKPKPDYDVVLQKIRYHAGAGNELEEILSAQNIDTVIISGLRTSGVVSSTVARLFDLDYNVYVIADTCIEAPPMGEEVDKALKAGVFPKLPANVIRLNQAVAALKRSGPAVY